MWAEADYSSAPAHIQSPSLAGSSKFTVNCDVIFGLGCLETFPFAASTCDMFDIFNTTADCDFFYAENDAPFAWYSAWAGPGGGPLHDLTVYSLEAIFQWTSGTLWDSTFKVDGVTVVTSTGKDFTVGPTDPFDISFFQYGGVLAGRKFYVSNISIKDASNAVVFADDFSSGSFATEGWTVTGAMSIGDSPLPPVPTGAPYRSPAWRFVVLDWATFEVLSLLDVVATSRQVTYTLDAPAQAVLNVPSDNPEVNIPWPTIADDPFVTEGTRVLLGLRRDGTYPVVWTPRFAGIIEQLEDTAQQDNAFTQVTAWDPWQYLMSRPVQNLDGTLPGANGISFTATHANVIIGELLRNTIINNGTSPYGVGLDMGVTYGGTAFYGGLVESCPAIDINFQQGLSVGEAWQQLTNNYDCDIVITPIYDPINRPGYLGEVNVYNQAGSERDDAIFAWDLPSKSLVQISRLYDGTLRANKIKFFAGQGGTASGGSTIPVQTDTASVTKYGEYWRQQFFPGQNVAGVVQLLAQAELAFSKDGRQTVTISPAPERSPHPFDEYFLGDRVPVYASDTKFRALLSGYQRVYGIPLTIGDDGTEQVQQLLMTEPTS